jgi:ketosteroid isomerase-like protein
MKKSLLVLSACILMAGSSCQKKIDIEKEKEAVKSVIQQEVDAFMSKDMEKLTSFYIKDELNTRLQETCSVEHPIYKGWNNVQSFLETLMKGDNPANTNVKNSKEDFIVKIKGDCAWVVNKDVWSWEANGKPVTGYGIQTTFMEKIDGSWKISLMSCFYRDQSMGNSSDTTSVKK